MQTPRRLSENLVTADRVIKTLRHVVLSLFYLHLQNFALRWETLSRYATISFNFPCGAVMCTARSLHTRSLICITFACVQFALDTIWSEFHSR
jgi:hypothetical protein